MTRYGCFIFICILYVCVNQVDIAPIEQCSQTYKASSGRTCRYCPPGTHKHADCVEDGSSALCITCNNGSYQHYCNRAEMCAPCDPRCFKPYTVMVKGCTLYDNIVCECEEGRYWDLGDVCLAHSKCTVGFGMVNIGNKQDDTECEECIEGQSFSNTKSFDRCTVCTKCLEYKKTCTTITDADCLLAWQDTSTMPYTTDESPEQRYPLSTIIIAAAVQLGATIVVVVFVVVCVYQRRNRQGNCNISQRNGRPQGIELQLMENGITAGRAQGLASAIEEPQVQDGPATGQPLSSGESNESQVSNVVETGIISPIETNEDSETVNPAGAAIPTSYDSSHGATGLPPRTPPAITEPNNAFKTPQEAGSGITTTAIVEQRESNSNTPHNQPDGTRPESTERGISKDDRKSATSDLRPFPVTSIQRNNDKMKELSEDSTASFSSVDNPATGQSLHLFAQETQPDVISFSSMDTSGITETDQSIHVIAQPTPTIVLDQQSSGRSDISSNNIQSTSPIGDFPPALPSNYSEPQMQNLKEVSLQWTHLA